MAITPIENVPNEKGRRYTEFRDSVELIFAHILTIFDPVTGVFPWPLIKTASG